MSGMVVQLRSVYDWQTGTTKIEPFSPDTGKLDVFCDLPIHQSELVTITRNSKVSRNWCIDSIDQLPKLRNLITHMKLVAQNKQYDALIANNFAVPVRIAYIRNGNITLINPRFKEGHGTKYCLEDSPDGSVIKKQGRYKTLTLTSLDESFDHKREYTFEGLASCVVQSVLDEMNAIV